MRIIRSANRKSSDIDILITLKIAGNCISIPVNSIRSSIAFIRIEDKYRIPIDCSICGWSKLYNDLKQLISCVRTLNMLNDLNVVNMISILKLNSFNFTRIQSKRFGLNRISVSLITSCYLFITSVNRINNKYIHSGSVSKDLRNSIWLGQISNRNIYGLVAHIITIARITDSELTCVTEISSPDLCSVLIIYNKSQIILICSWKIRQHAIDRLCNVDLSFLILVIYNCFMLYAVSGKSDKCWSLIIIRGYLSDFGVSIIILNVNQRIAIGQCRSTFNDTALCSYRNFRQSNAIRRTCFDRSRIRRAWFCNRSSTIHRISNRRVKLYCNRICLIRIISVTGNILYDLKATLVLVCVIIGNGDLTCFSGVVDRDFRLCRIARNLICSYKIEVNVFGNILVLLYHFIISRILEGNLNRLTICNGEAVRINTVIDLFSGSIDVFVRIRIQYSKRIYSICIWIGTGYIFLNTQRVTRIDIFNCSTCHRIGI